MLQRLNKRAATSGRADDNEETMKKVRPRGKKKKRKQFEFTHVLSAQRLVTYNETTTPVIDHFKKQDLLKQLDAEQEAAKVLEDAVAQVSSVGFTAV